MASSSISFKRKTSLPPANLFATEQKRSTHTTRQPAPTTSIHRESDFELPSLTPSPPAAFSGFVSDHSSSAGSFWDYEDAGSPSGSSTASGPVYVRTPGFQHHGHAFAVSSPPPTTSPRDGKDDGGGDQSDGHVTADTILPDSSVRSKPAAGSSSSYKKKKSNSAASMIEVVTRNDGSAGTRPKHKKEPLPMKLRALPQSFWQQPNEACNVSPAIIVPLLPPLLKFNDPSDDVTEVRPITPPEERENAGSAGSSRSEGSTRVIRVSNTDLLLKLFEGVDEKSKQQTAPIVRRGRPKKAPSTIMARTLRGEDPCLVSTATEGILPLLPGNDRNGSGSSRNIQQQTLTLVSVRDGDKSVSLPALNVEHNYSQVLSELVMKL